MSAFFSDQFLEKVKIGRIQILPYIFLCIFSKILFYQRPTEEL